MARTLSATITNLLAQDNQRTCHLLTFTVGATVYRFTDGDAVNHLGNDYTPHLAVERGPRYSEQLRNDPVTVRLQNITLATAQTLKAEGVDIQGVEATLERLFLAARETVVLFKGSISDVSVNERDATLELAAELDPTASQVPRRKYSPMSSTDGKTFLEWAATPHLFDGFLHITRDLTLSVEGQSPGYPEDERALGNLYD